MPDEFESEKDVWTCTTTAITCTTMSVAGILCLIRRSALICFLAEQIFTMYPAWR
jgi:hypothetical protein